MDEDWLELNNITAGMHKVGRYEAKRICAAASEYASLDPDEIGRDPAAYEYFLSPRHPRSPAVKCGTIPVSYVRFNASNYDTVFVMTESNKYEETKFRADLVIPAFEPQPSQSENSPGQKVEKKRLSAFDNQNLLNVCLAAKKYLLAKKDQIPARLPGFLGRYVEPAKLYRVKYSKGYEDRAAIKCPTKPRMYVWYANLRQDADMHILLVQEKKEERAPTVEDVSKSTTS